MKDRLTRGAAWLAATRLLVNLVGFASTIILARLLLPADFGLVAIATTIAAVVGSITELSLSSALVQHDNPNDRHFDSAWTLNVARAVLLAALLAAIAHPVARFYADPRLLEIMFALSATTLLGGFGNPKLVVFTRNLVFWQEFAMGVSQKLLGFVVAIAVAIIYQSYWALIVGGAAAQLLGIFLSYVLLPYCPKVQLAGSRSLLGFSVWLTFGQMVRTANYRSDSLFIGYFLGNGPLGHYTLGDNLAALPTREATAPVSQTLFPAFARLRGDLPRLRAAYQRSQAVLVMIALPIGCGFAMLAEPFVRLTLGENWLPAVIVIQVLASNLAFQTLGAPLQPLAMAMGETRLMFQRDLANFIVRMPLMVAGLLLGGLAGVVMARSASGLLNVAINLGLARRLLALPVVDQLGANGRTIFGAIFMMIGLAIVQQFDIAPRSGSAAVIELAGMIFFGLGAYAGSVYCLWVHADRPLGPETEILEVLTKLQSFTGKDKKTFPTQP